MRGHPDHRGLRAVLAVAYGQAGNRGMLESEESRVLEQSYPGVYLGVLAMAHALPGEHRRAFEPLELGVERSTDNLQVLIELNFRQLEGFPGFDECYAAMKALHERNLAQY